MRTGLRKGFTLIELLTVIAIIAVLAAILFPVFARMREGVRQGSCISNMHAIYVAVESYRRDHSEEYPPLLLGYAERPDGLPWQTGDPTPVEAARIKHSPLLGAYMKNDINAFHCPDDPVRDQVTLTAPSYTGSAYAGPAIPYSGSPVFNTTGTKVGFPFPSLAAGFNGKPINYYGYDSYDITTVYGGPKGSFQVAYNRDWTGDQSGTPDKGKSDKPFQLKYLKPPADQTIIAFCNNHVTVAGGNLSPMLLASGTAKPVDCKKLAEYGWTFATVP